MLPGPCEDLGGSRPGTSTQCQARSECTYTAATVGSSLFPELLSAVAAILKQMPGHLQIPQPELQRRAILRQGPWGWPSPLAAAANFYLHLKCVPWWLASQSSLPALGVARGGLQSSEAQPPPPRGHWVGSHFPLEQFHSPVKPVVRLPGLGKEAGEGINTPSVGLGWVLPQQQS